ncbi:spore cortex-lytic enzyme [Clostridium oryzae]|uniref:Spore cortex-lytic enzyme n=1 Tax=Clostridium oryzae TaxID=1450648 RepID=A0A1V4IJC8_9CLOT|nr:spore cortex-lytic enzyme [Clostridium oryzae]OPJ60122.1 spore cortex-lytic enzyme precursor [Clostridium oryzae]
MHKKILKCRKKKMAIFSIVLVLLVALVCLFPYYTLTGAATYSWGSRGSTVREIQTRLKRWGYYYGTVDGIYGYRTYSSVKWFQSKNGLPADGVAGNRTLAALGINTTAGTTSTYAARNQNEILLSRLINGEARGEPYTGQVAVGAVVLNRIRDPRFPNSVAGVIYQPGAFTAIVDGQIHAEILSSSVNAARDALNGWDPSGGALYYFNPAKSTSQWIWSRPLIKIIGKHRFCR